MNRVWTAIVLSGAGTYAMRASFILAADRLATVPPWAERVLRQIPAAALAALVVPALVRPEETLDLANPRLVAGVVAGLVAWKTRNVALTLVIGLAGLMALEAVA